MDVVMALQSGTILHALRIMQRRRLPTHPTEEGITVF